MPVATQSLVPLTGPYAEWLQGQSETITHLYAKGEDQWVCVERLLLHWTLKVGEVGDEFGYTDRFCYQTQIDALAAAARWAAADWQDEPTGWHRHPHTGRRRPDGDANREYINH